MTHSEVQWFGSPLLKLCELNILHSLRNLHLICVSKSDTKNPHPTCFCCSEPVVKGEEDQSSRLEFVTRLQNSLHKC